MHIQQALYGSLFATAIGDMYGLPYEGLSPRRIAKRFAPDRFALIPFIHGGMVSDDTDHAIMTVQAYIKSGGEPDRFVHALRWQLMRWLLTLPAGIGLATGRSLFKMWLFVDKMGGRTGVFSAGNGSAMRASVLGVLCEDLTHLKQLNHLSTTLTHTDPKAEQGSYLIALLAWVETRHSDWQVGRVFEFLKTQIDDDELLHLLSDYKSDDKGVSGYMYHSVPAVYQAWQTYRHDPIAGMNALIKLGGDTDSTCAIFGGVVGITCADELSIAGVWCEPKIRPDFLARLANQAQKVYDTRTPSSPVRFGGVLTLWRNLGFLGIVLLHGVGRLLPPY